jgi:hypothetical protein
VKSGRESARFLVEFGELLATLRVTLPLRQVGSTESGSSQTERRRLRTSAWTSS